MSSQRSAGKMGIKFFLRISQASYSSEEENKQWIVHQRGKAGKLRKVRRIRFSASSSPLPSHYSFITGDLWYYRNGPPGSRFCLDRSLFSPAGDSAAAADADGKHSEPEIQLKTGQKQILFLATEKHEKEKSAKRLEKIYVARNSAQGQALLSRGRAGN